jgi:hypothetical protein
MHDVVLLKAIFIISNINYVVVSANEVTIVDVQQWINIHVYMMKNWKQIPILLTLEKVEMGTTSNNINVFILNAMGRYGVLLMKPWPPSGYAVNAMVIMCSMAIKLG